MVYPNKYFQAHNFREAELRAEDLDTSALDTEFANIESSLNLQNTLLRAITTANGTLKYDVVSRQTFTATAGQTAFTLTTPYNTTDDRIEAFTNGGSGNQSKIPNASITKTSSTVATLPAQTVGATVEIWVYSPGNGNTSLASTGAGQGASLIGVEDSGGLYAGDSVEECLAEVMGALNDYITLVGTLTNYIKIDGSVAMAAALNLGTHKITNVSAGTNPGDAVNYSQLSAYINVWSNLATNFLSLAGGTMSGPIDMGGSGITSLDDGTAADDAATCGQVLLASGANKWTGDSDADSHRLRHLLAPIADDEPVRRVDLNTLVPSLVTPPFANMVVITSDGTWTVPAGVTRLMVELWGGGGGGENGATTADGDGGGGGGGGGYGKDILTVVAGHVLTIDIGDGGAASASGAATVVTDTTASTELLRSNGGSPGSGKTGGSGGTSGATFNITGGKGGHGHNINSSDSAIGGMGGGSANGGAGGTNGGYDSGAISAGNGIAPGGGGGGGGDGGSGGKGRVVLFY